MICLMCGHKIIKQGFLNRKSHYRDCPVIIEDEQKNKKGVKR